MWYLQALSRSDLENLCQKKDEELRDSQLLVELLYGLYSDAVVNPVPKTVLEQIVSELGNVFRQHEEVNDGDCPF